MNTLRKKEYEMVLDTISKVGLSVKEFSFDNSEKRFSITYSDTRLKFILHPHPSELNQFTYGYTLYKRDFPMLGGDSKYKYIVDILANLKKWLSEHVIEYITEENRPDPLEKYLQAANGLLEDFNDDDSGKFSEIEIEKITTANKKLIQLLEENYNIPDEQKEKISNKLKDIEEKAKTLDKNVWKPFALKTLYDIGVNIIANVAASIVMAGGTALITQSITTDSFFRLVRIAYSLAQGI